MTNLRTFPDDPYEAQQRLLSDKDPRDIIILDVGAHVGQTAVKYRTLFNQSQIHCFEPFPESLEALKKNAPKDDKVVVVPSAVSDRCEKTTFYVNEFSPTNSLLPRPSHARRYFPSFADKKATIEVDTITLDFYCEQNAIKHIEILKFDIQGGELLALNGAQRLLENQNVSLIYTEIMFVPHYEGGALFHKICSYLEKYGYSLFDIYDLHHAKNGQLRYGDALFVSKDIRENVIDEYPVEE